MNATNYSLSSSGADCPHTIDDEYVAVDNIFTVVSITLNLFTCPLVILLNILIIIAVRTKRNLQTMHNILLASMAGTDLMVGIASQPVFIAQESFLMAGGSISLYCKFFFIQKAITTCLCLLSLLHLVLIGVERFIAMKYSLRYDSIVTKFRLTVAVACCWVIIIVYWAIWLLYDKIIPAYAFVIVSLTVIIYCHSSVYFICRRHLLQIKSEQISSEASSKFLKERKAWKTTTYIIVGVLISYCSALFSGIAFRYSPVPVLNRIAVSSQPLRFSFFMFNSLLNPIIYCWRIKNIRKAMLQLLKKQDNQ